MKNVLASCCVFLFLSCGNPSSNRASPGQQGGGNKPDGLKKEPANPYVPVDVSPMDMAYFPADYPIKKMTDSVAVPLVARVIYSRPHRAGRKIFGGLVSWGQPWRLGVNEATEMEFFKPVTIQNKRIDKGRYLVYAIPYEGKWTIVFNTNLYSWGLKFNQKDDVAKFDVPATTKDQTIEYFTIDFEKAATGADLLMAWEALEVRLPIQF